MNYLDEIIKRTGLSRWTILHYAQIGRLKAEKLGLDSVPYWFVSKEEFDRFMDLHSKTKRNMVNHYSGNLPDKVFTPNEALKKDLKLGTGLCGTFNDETAEVTVSFIDLLKFVDYLNPDIIIDRTDEHTLVEFLIGKPDVSEDID